jgi:hypothetical protein
MRKPLIMAIAFVASTLLGVVLLLISSTVISFVFLAIERHKHPGLGAVAGSISETAAVITPLLCGVSAYFSPCAGSNAQNPKLQPTLSSQPSVNMEY